MPFVEAEVGRDARWCDLGCAYGFLVGEAGAAGFRGFGVDASRFAVGEAQRHAAAAVGRIACAHAERLPFRTGSLDVVSAFDVLEHVPDPAAVIAEAARVLRPGGLFLAATPDPMVFDRAEPTHIAERVPSWWVRTLEGAGFGVALRFFQAAYNCELVARRGAPAPAISYDALGTSEPLLVLHGEGSLRAALRSGFGPLEAGSRVVEDGAVVYLLDTSPAPLEVECELTLVAATPIRLRLDDRIVAREPRARFLLPAGGHALHLQIEGGWARLSRIRLSARPVACRELCLTLPFDLYERYALASRVIEIVAHSADADRPGAKGAGAGSGDPAARGALRLLDVGGTIGGDGGHLAWSGDFFPDLEVTVVDRRPADYPEHVAHDVQRGLDFADRSFDVVTAFDVLEHVPRAARAGWLTEMWRVTGRWLLVAGPFATPGVADADRYLFELIRSRFGYEHGFLAEHLALGHPELESTARFFREQGASVTVLPSGDLPAWVLMQTVNALLSHPEQEQAYPRANAVFNATVGLAGAREPAYRHLLVIDRQAVSHEAALAVLRAPESPHLPGVLAALAALPGASGSAADRSPDRAGDPRGPAETVNRAARGRLRVAARLRGVTALLRRSLSTTPREHAGVTTRPDLDGEKKR